MKTISIYGFIETVSDKYFEDERGFVYKRVNQNETTVYLDCVNEPRCLVAARFYKKSKEFRLFGNHLAEICPPDQKMKTKIHFEEFLKKEIERSENASVSVLNVYKQAIENRYNGIWLSENHRQNFLPVLRRIRNYLKTIDGKAKGVKCDEIGKQQFQKASSLITNVSLAQVENSAVPSVATVSTKSDNIDEKVCVGVQVFTHMKSDFF